MSWMTGSVKSAAVAAEVCRLHTSLKLDEALWRLALNNDSSKHHARLTGAGEKGFVCELSLSSGKSLNQLRQSCQRLSNRGWGKLGLTLPSSRILANVAWAASCTVRHLSARRWLFSASAKQAGSAISTLLSAQMQSKPMRGHV